MANAFPRIGKVFVADIISWRITTPPSIAVEEEAGRNFASEVEEAKAIVRLVPKWTTVVYAIVFALPPTLFTKQGATMDRYVTQSFDIPADSLQSFVGLAIARRSHL
ncbi:hypothetical protein WN943_008734 [Citrus x changshan-huyou]